MMSTNINLTAMDEAKTEKIYQEVLEEYEEKKGQVATEELRAMCENNLEFKKMAILLKVYKLHIKEQ